MRDSIKLEGGTLSGKKYCELMESLESGGYKLIIDPRGFDTPITIKARFKNADPDVRFFEFSPSLELSLEHNTTRPKAKSQLKQLGGELSEMMLLDDVKVEDYELAALQMFSRKNPILTPSNEADEKLFRSLEKKQIFTRVTPVKCPDCSRSFLFPSLPMENGKNRVFCTDCRKWFNFKDDKETYVINEQYMEAMGGVWDKMQKLISASWKEIIKRGVPVLPTKKDE